LSGYYPVILRASWLDPTVAFSVAVIAALVALTCWLAWRGAPDAFWLAWFGITLSPMLNLIPFPALMNDRYLYLPLLGALVPLLRIGQTLLQRMDALRLAPAAVAIVVAISVGLTVARVPVFRNELNLWADFGLRFSYITSDRPWGPPPRREEKQLLAEALKRHPERAALHNNVGGFAFEEGRFADALGSLERAYALGPDDPTIALNLGRTYLALNRVDDAVRTLERAVQLEPAAFFPQLNLARGYLLRGDLVRARATLERAKSIKQEPFFWQQVEQQLARAEIRAGS
jgi:tetratricopeptide (TPR) repeat protein